MATSSTAAPHALPLTLRFAEIGAESIALVGGKGANLGAMTRAGFRVPDGFCVTTVAFRHFLAGVSDAEALYQRLEALAPHDIEAVREVGAQVRARLHQAPLPAEVGAAIIAAWQLLGDDGAYAVRSSATAEDLPDASFAGQQDTYLQVRGREALLERVKDCWVSLFTDRAILYRQQQGFDHREVALSVVVQRMVVPEVAGIMFTADPVSGHRGIISIDASFGLGEALVSGLVSADLYQVEKRSRRVVKRQIAEKALAIRALPEGGVVREALTGEDRQRPALTDAQVQALAALGGEIEAHYGLPQDIEWALAGDTFYVLQARPITSLYPLPAPGPTDEALHLYFSFSHLQVMTDPMPELSLSIWRILFAPGRSKDALESPYLVTAGGRLYADISAMMRRQPFQTVLPRIMMNVDQLVAQAIKEVATRAEFQRAGGERVAPRSLAQWLVPQVGRVLKRLCWDAPEAVVRGVNHGMARHLDRSRRALADEVAGAPRFRAAIRLVSEAFTQLVWTIAPSPLTGFLALALLKPVVGAGGAPDDFEALGRGVVGNVTTEMDLAVGDLADLVRGSPALLAHLRRSDLPTATLLATAGEVEGGAAFVKGWADFIERYGVRAPGEIDLHRPRWCEEPTSLLKMVLGNAQGGDAGAHRRHHQRLVAEGEAAAARLVAAAARAPGGWIRGRVAGRLVRVARHLVALREHHKFALIQLLGLVKPVIAETGAQLVAQGHLDSAEEIWFLTVGEIMALLDKGRGEVRGLVASRRAALERFRSLTPPRVITSDGEIPVVHQTLEGAPEGALIGSPVSAGVVEGIARVVLDPQKEMLHPGEILVAPFTDPGWTPLFINASGLVMEVGGLMTHGSVVAREYGLPAVVGVQGATQRITTGQRVRVHGNLGYVELL